MNRNDVLRILADHQDELRQQFAVKSLALFGSMARDEAADTSDVNLLVEFDRAVGYFHIFRLQDYVSNLLGGAQVDLVLRRAVIDDLKQAVYGEAVVVVG